MPDNTLPPTPPAHPHVRLVQVSVDPALRQIASDIVHGVESGEVIGLGIVAALRGSYFFVDAFDHLRKLAAARDYC
jgi:hypothetical protein